MEVLNTRQDFSKTRQLDCSLQSRDSWLSKAFCFVAGPGEIYLQQEEPASVAHAALVSSPRSAARARRTGPTAGRAAQHRLSHWAEAGCRRCGAQNRKADFKRCQTSCGCYPTPQGEATDKATDKIEWIIVMKDIGSLRWTKLRFETEKL